MIRFKKDDGSNYPDIVEDKMQNLSKINQGLQIAIENRFDKPGDGRYFYDVGGKTINRFAPVSIPP